MCYVEAIGVESDCVEAIYNCGLTDKKLGNHQKALQRFMKLSKMQPDNIEVIYQICDLYDLLGDPKNSIKKYEYLNSVLVAPWKCPQSYR